MTVTLDAKALGIDMHDRDAASLFKWLVASFLMGKRIRAAAAVAAYRVIVEVEGRDTPAKLAASGHRELVRMLGRAGYARYDESTATRLVALGKRLLDEYQGSVAQLIEHAADRADLERRLRMFEGIGPKTAEIFLCEALPAVRP
jgi:endonuclease III